MVLLQEGTGSCRNCVLICSINYKIIGDHMVEYKVNTQVKKSYFYLQWYFSVIARLVIQGEQSYPNYFSNLII